MDDASSFPQDHFASGIRKNVFDRQLICLSECLPPLMITMPLVLTNLISWRQNWMGAEAATDSSNGPNNSGAITPLRSPSSARLQAEVAASLWPALRLYKPSHI
ncbi:hypothetical protein RRG08_054617 [Elysia crispata]|uniref:Uncharacterized protein n=1 Tax=Elysia crispata TaxID=231223 RepID=A0AAE1B0L7_9GAST|nr:hypothetical protein RRG08_054617 [Elysia crispata]